MQTNPAAEQNKNVKWSESPRNQSGRNQPGNIDGYGVIREC